MKFPIVKNLRSLPLKEYAEDYGETCITVWINPPRDLREQQRLLNLEFANHLVEHSRCEAEFKCITDPAEEVKVDYQRTLADYQAWMVEWNERMLGWFAQMWSQGAEGTHWTVEELKAIDQSDPKLLLWMIDRTREMQDLKKG